MNDDIGVYESDGKIISGVEGHESLTMELDFGEAILFFEFKIDKKSIIGSRIKVRKGNSGRLQVIVAMREVSKIDSNLTDTIFKFAEDVKSEVNELGYTILDENFNKIKSMGSSPTESSDEMRAVLVLNAIEGKQTWIKSSDPIKTLPLMNMVYKELEPVARLINFSFLMSVLRHSTSVWISNQIKDPTIDFDTEGVDTEDISVKLKLYKAYSELRVDGKLKGIQSKEDLIEWLKWVANIPTKKSLNNVLAYGDKYKLEAFADSDLPKLLDLLDSIEILHDINWAIDVIDRDHQHKYNLDKYRNIKAAREKHKYKWTSSRRTNEISYSKPSSSHSPPKRENIYSSHVWTIVSCICIMLVGGLIFVVYQDVSQPDVEHQTAIPTENSENEIMNVTDTNECNSSGDGILDNQMTGSSNISEHTSNESDEYTGDNSTEHNGVVMPENATVNTSY